MAGAASQAGDAEFSRAPGLTSDLQGSVNVHRGALLFRLGRKSGITIGLEQSRGDRTWDYVRSVSFMYGSLRRRLWDEKNKMADNVRVAIESSGDQFVLRLYND